MSRSWLGTFCACGLIVQTIGCTGNVGAVRTGTAGNAGGAAGASGAAGGGTGTASDPTSAGVRPLRLLSGREYLNTVRDLLGDTTLADTALPTGDEDPLATPSFAFKEPHDVATQDATLLQAAAEALAKNAATRLTTLLPCATPPAASSQQAACLGRAVRRHLHAQDVPPAAAKHRDSGSDESLSNGSNDAGARLQ